MITHADIEAVHATMLISHGAYFAYALVVKGAITHILLMRVKIGYMYVCVHYLG